MNLDAIRPLWEKLNTHQAQRFPRFGSALSNRTFESRKQTLLAKAGRLRAELVFHGSEMTGVAYCISTVSTDGIGEIDSIFVEESLRSQGIGTELMRHAFVWFDRMKVTSMIVSIMYENDDALAFYRHFGFYPRTVLLQKNDDDAC